MRCYTLRDEHGVMKAKLSNTFARHIFEAADGHWVNTELGTGRRYILDENTVFSDSHLRLYFWEHDYIQLETK